MTVEDQQTIDIAGIDRDSGAVVLTVSDHLDWQKPEEHLLVLQEKINGYLRYVESGEILRNYPDATNRKIEIEVVGKFSLPRSVDHFVRHATEIVRGAGIDLKFSVLESKTDELGES